MKIKFKYLSSFSYVCMYYRVATIILDAYFNAQNSLI